MKLRRLIAALALVTLAVLANALTANADTKTQQIERSIGEVTAQFAHGRKPQTGTAFCVYSDGTYSYFLTAYHVVQDAVTIKIAIFKPTYTSWNATIVAPGAGTTDLAVLRVKQANVPPLAFSLSLKDTNDDVSAVGFPLTFVKIQSEGHRITANWSTGRVSSLIPDNNYLVLGLAPSMQPGNSGGPVLEPDSFAVVGLVVAASDPLNSWSVDFAVPALYEIIPFLRGKHVTIRESTPERASRGSLTNRWSTTTSNFLGSVTFGGGDYCNYVDDISVRALSFRLQGNTISDTTFQMHVREEVIPPCQLAPFEANDQLLNLVPGSFVARNNVIDVAFAGSPFSHPWVDAQFHGVLNGDQLVGSVIVHRKDAYPVLNWTVPIDVVLQRS